MADPDEPATGMDALPPALVINLDRSPERLRDVTARFRVMGIEIERFPAVDARLERERCAAALHLGWFRTFTRRDCVPGEIGCALSHFALWESLRDRAGDTFLVLEDDAVPTQLLCDLPLALKSLPDDWEILVLADDMSTGPFWSRWAGAIELVRYARPGYLSVAYVVHRRFLKRRRLWTRPRPFRFSLDYWRFWFLWHGVAVYSTREPVVRPPGGADAPQTTIGSPVARPKLQGLGALRSMLFRVPLYTVGGLRVGHARARLRWRAQAGRRGP